MNNSQLVSVCVITYNSSSTIVETLESVKNQSYKNIELIISDDCSTDNTVSICQQWLSECKDRFLNSKVVFTDCNKGISGNINRAVSEANGSWLKLIAGDDILLPDCIQYYVNQIVFFQNTSIFLSKVQPFQVAANGIKHLEVTNNYGNEIAYFNKLSAYDQCRYLLQEGGNILAAPTLFIQADLLRQYPYNESYRYMEDYPQWVRLTDKGYSIKILADVTVLYRKSNSISRSCNTYYSYRLLETKNLYFWAEKLSLLKKYNCEKGYNETKRLFLATTLIDGLTNNRKTLFNNIRVAIILLLTKFIKFKL